jgi:beta-phosphoglucomutase
LDGVIVSTDEQHFQAWDAIARQENIEFNREINRRQRGVSRMESLDILLENANRRYSEAEKNALATEKNALYVQLIQTITPADILPGVLDLLADLKKHGIRTAIGSSSKNTKTILSRIGLSDRFDAIIDGNQIERSKPFPDVFVKAADATKTPYQQCLVIEDALAGIEAAKAAGMKSLSIGIINGADLSTRSLSTIQTSSIAALFE